jgi:hypothetical protein
VNQIIAYGFEITAWEQALETSGKIDIRGYSVHKIAVLFTVLFHQDFTIFLDELRLDFAGVIGDQPLDILFASDDRFLYLDYTLRAEGIGFSRNAQSWFGAFITSQQRSRRPLWLKRLSFR